MELTHEGGLGTSEIVPALRASAPDRVHGGLRLADRHDQPVEPFRFWWTLGGPSTTGRGFLGTVVASGEAQVYRRDARSPRREARAATASSRIWVDHNGGLIGFAVGGLSVGLSQGRFKTRRLSASRDKRDIRLRSRQVPDADRRGPEGRHARPLRSSSRSPDSNRRPTVHAEFRWLPMTPVGKPVCACRGFPMAAVSRAAYREDDTCRNTLARISIPRRPL